MKNCVLANIGNSASEICTWSAGKPVDIYRFPTPALLADTWQWPVPGTAPILAACVVPKVRQRLTALLGNRIIWLTADLITSLDFSAVDPTTIGADRLANAVAAATLRPLPAIVVDCWTAITLEAVDADRRFRGGAILPGRKLSRQALHTGTGQLPEVPMSEALPAALGTTTVDAIRAGIDLGLLGTVERLVQDAAHELGGGLPALAVGGDASYFTQHLACLRKAPDHFTLHGLAEIATALF